MLMTTKTSSATSTSAARVCRPHAVPRIVCQANREDCIKLLEQYSMRARANLATNLADNFASGRSKVSTSSAAVMQNVVVCDIEEINQNNFYDALRAAGEQLVVVDFYTQWCGPCKLIYPELVKMASEMPGAKFFKFNCNKDNKDLGVKLNIKAAPTFHLYKNSEKLAEMTGANAEKLRGLLSEHKQ